MQIKPDQTRKNSTIRLYLDVLDTLEKLSTQCNVSKSVFVESVLCDSFKNLRLILAGSGIFTINLNNKITTTHAKNCVERMYPDINVAAYTQSDNDFSTISVNINGNHFDNSDIECVFYATLNEIVSSIDTV